MTFVALQESLRKELRKRIDAGELTGMELARRAGFTQAHISNFLNRKRGLKLTALDRVLRAIGQSVYDLLNPHELARFAAVPAGAATDYAEVPLVEAIHAAGGEVIVNEEVKDLLPYARGMLGRIRAEPASPTRKSWTRFVLIRVEGKEALSMWPRFGPGAILLLDRHYTSLRPYRKDDRNIYVVRKGDGLTVRYVDLSGTVLILRPHNSDYPIELLPMEGGQNPGERIVGRVAHIALEA
jgi:transcriptional regulator with XRE-family HTH domain